LGQRATLLMPLINMRQPKTARSSASASKTNVGVSKANGLLEPGEKFRRTIVSLSSAVN